MVYGNRNSKSGGVASEGFKPPKKFIDLVYYQLNLKITIAELTFNNKPHTYEAMRL